MFAYIFFFNTWPESVICYDQGRGEKGREKRDTCKARALTCMGFAATEYKPPTYHARWCGYEPL